MSHTVDMVKLGLMIFCSFAKNEGQQTFSRQQLNIWKSSKSFALSSKTKALNRIPFSPSHGSRLLISHTMLTPLDGWWCSEEKWALYAPNGFLFSRPWKLLSVKLVIHGCCWFISTWWLSSTNQRELSNFHGENCFIADPELVAAEWPDLVTNWTKNSGHSASRPNLFSIL